MKKTTALITIILLISSINGYGQCDGFPDSYLDAIDKVPVIVEGKILTNAGDMFGGKYDNDYASIIVEVYKILKGDFNAKYIEVVQPIVSVTHGRQSSGNKRGEPIGIFLLKPSDVTETPKDSIPPELKFGYYSLWTCNFIGYNRSVTTTKDWITRNKYGLTNLKDLKNKLYDPVKKRTGRAYREIKPLEKKNCTGIFQKNAFSNLKIGGTNPTITEFYPDTIAAGKLGTLTILGSGFSES